jgi:hypothetical protein
MQNHRTKFFLIIAIGILFLSCAGPESLLRTHAYEGTRKAASEMATVFAVWNGPGFEMASICSADGKSYWKFGTISNCLSVIYLRNVSRDTHPSQDPNLGDCSGFGASLRSANYLE